MTVHDYCVIGGGIVGLATADELVRRFPGASVVVLEKECRIAAHQTGHNSGVIHSGIYYAPGSLKARLCKAGAAATEQLATEYGIPFERCGKLLVATTPRELESLTALESRAAVNGIAVERLDRRELVRREPAVRGLGALHVAQTGIVDYRLVAQALATRVRAAGGHIETAASVTGITETTDQVRVDTTTGQWTARRLIVCGGLQADRLARTAGLKIDFQIVPFRGEYFRLPEGRKDIVRHLIYPVPDPALPFLGIHLTRTVDGGITVGPNAVLALAREGYPRGSFSKRDVGEYLRFPGMWRVARANVATGVRELRDSLSRRAYLTQCRKYCPELTLRDLRPEPAGIRAQAVLRDGTMVHDFMFLATERTLHVANAPSPAATSALPIARHVVDRLTGRK